MGGIKAAHPLFGYYKKISGSFYNLIICLENNTKFNKYNILCVNIANILLSSVIEREIYI